MKKIILTLTTITFISAAFAQLNLPKFGISAGINVAKNRVSIGGVSATSDASLVGLHLNGFVELGIGNNFSIQPELQYSQLGNKTNLIPSGTTTLNLDYLNIPLIVKYRIQHTGLGLYVGPQIGFLLSAKQKGDVKESFKTTDFAGIFGAEYSFPVGLVLSARYQAGFSNISKNTMGDTKVTNNAFSFTIGYKF